MTDSHIPYTLAVKYARFVDDRQFERMREIISSNFTQQGPGFASNSADEFLQQLQILNNYSATFHLVGNQYGEWHNEVYTGETYGVASHLYEKEGVPFKLDMGIRYQDVIENTGKGYHYLSRDLNIVWTQDLPTQG
jgi:hypothetical protein